MLDQDLCYDPGALEKAARPLCGKFRPAPERPELAVSAAGQCPVCGGENLAGSASLSDEPHPGKGDSE